MLLDGMGREWREEVVVRGKQRGWSAFGFLLIDVSSFALLLPPSPLEALLRNLAESDKSSSIATSPTPARVSLQSSPVAIFDSVL